MGSAAAAVSVQGVLAAVVARTGLGFPPFAHKNIEQIHGNNCQYYHICQDVQKHKTSYKCALSDILPGFRFFGDWVNPKFA
jgi:hypothetical protein